VTGNDVIDELEEVTSIQVVAEDRLPGDSASHHVVHAAGDLETRRTRHPSKVVPPGRRRIVGATFVTMS
jgi:hypothetical protein